MEQRLAELENRIGYRFADRELLQAALTHRSFSNEQGGGAIPHNERLEFLGDAVLGLAVSDELCRCHPEFHEGELTRLRAEVVNAVSLAAVARSLEVGSCLRLGRGEERSGGRDKESLLADALEALLGAIFRDGGWAAVHPVVIRLLRQSLQRAASDDRGSDYKTRLQESLQGRFGRVPLYLLVGVEGPDHERLYRVEVRFDGNTIGRGSGRSKKSAEQAAAAEALAFLDAATDS